METMTLKSHDFNYTKDFKLLIHHVSWEGGGENCNIEWDSKNKKKIGHLKLLKIYFYRRTSDHKEEKNNLASHEVT